MISLTANREWEDLVEELKKEIYHQQSNVFDNAQNWDQVCFLKGWCAALAYIINLRDTTKLQLEQIEGGEDADVQLPL